MTANESVSLTVHTNKETLKVPQAILEYLTEIDPKKIWNRRGFKATNYEDVDAKTTHHRLQKMIENRMDQYESKINDFVEKCLKVYRSLRDNPDSVINTYFPDKEFIVVIGPPRSGGTYVLRELFKIENVRVENYSHTLVSDGFPISTAIFEWRQKDQFNHLLFFLAQWLIWSSEEMEEFDFIFKKHYSFGHLLPLMESLFGDQITYLITTRHPGFIAQSFGERYGVNDPSEQFYHDGFAKSIMSRKNSPGEEELQTYSFNELTMKYWIEFYKDFLTIENLKGSVTTLPFGDERESAIQQFVNRISGREIEPEPFEPTERTLGEFWRLPETKDKLQAISDEWGKVFGKKLL